MERAKRDLFLATLKKLGGDVLAASQYVQIKPPVALKWIAELGLKLDDSGDFILSEFIK